MIKIFEQDGEDGELFALIGRMALSKDVHDALGVAVTSADGDIWLVSIKGDKANGFAQLRLMKSGVIHLRYLYSESMVAKLDLGRQAIKHAGHLAASLLYANELRDSPIMPQLGFVKTTASGKTKYARWERNIK